MVSISGSRLEYYCQLPTATISALGALFIIFLFIFAKPLRVYAFNLVFWLSFFDLIKFSLYLVPWYDIESLDNTWCSILAFATYFANYSTFAWTLAIACTLYQCLIFNIENIEKYYKFWLVTCFTYSTVFSMIPLFTQSYGYFAYICELKTNTFGTIYRVSLFYTSFAFVLIAITYVYVKIYAKYSVTTYSFGSSGNILSVKRLLVYPFIMIVCMGPSFIVEILGYWEIENIIASIICYSIWNLHGFLNAMAYGLTRPVISYLKSIYLNRRNHSTDDISLFDTFAKSRIPQVLL